MVCANGGSHCILDDLGSVLVAPILSRTVAKVEEIVENSTSFARHCGLKPLERQRFSDRFFLPKIKKAFKSFLVNIWPEVSKRMRQRRVVHLPAHMMPT